MKKLDQTANQGMLQSLFPPSQSVAAEGVRGLLNFGQLVSCAEIEASIEDSLGSRHVGGALALEIWRQDWKPESSDGDAMGPTDTLVASVAAKAATRFKFESFQAREDGVADSILQTYTWIYECDVPSQHGQPLWSSFPDWLERNGHPVYWITGKPGSGKSTIMKHILRSPALGKHLRIWAGPLPLLIVRYYTWNAGAVL